jgi:hypothetical protein
MCKVFPKAFGAGERTISRLLILMAVACCHALLAGTSGMADDEVTSFFALREKAAQQAEAAEKIQN